MKNFIYSKNSHNEIEPDQCSEYDEQNRGVCKQFSEVVTDDQDNRLLAGEHYQNFAKSFNAAGFQSGIAQNMQPNKTPQTKSVFPDITLRNLNSERQQSATKVPQGNSAPLPYE